MNQLDIDAKKRLTEAKDMKAHLELKSNLSVSDKDSLELANKIIKNNGYFLNRY